MRICFLLSILPLLSISLSAQSYSDLTPVKNSSINAFYSNGHQQRAELISQRVEKAINWYAGQLSFKPAVTLLVLSSTDWPKFAEEGAVYGMPHYKGNKTLVVAAEDNAFWQSFVPPADQLDASLRDQLTKAYSVNGRLSMQAFFDLLALHELGHAFHLQDSLTMQRKWMGELFSNIFLHTYIAENEPASLPALTLFPEMVVAGGAKGFQYTSLSEVHEKYDEIGRNHPRNYGWYQSRWHKGAATIYDTGGKNVVLKLWAAFKQNKVALSDDALIGFLEGIDKGLADLVRNWDRDTLK